MSPRIRRFSNLSCHQQILVRLCQRVNFGQICNLTVRNCEPLFEASVFVLIDERLDAEEQPRVEIGLEDFQLPAELCRLMTRIDEIRNGRIERIEVRAGVPRRVVFQSGLTDLVGLDIKT